MGPSRWRWTRTALASRWPTRTSGSPRKQIWCILRTHPITAWWTSQQVKTKAPVIAQKQLCFPSWQASSFPTSPAWPGCFGTSASPLNPSPQCGVTQALSGCWCSLEHWVPTAPHTCTDRTGFVQNPQALHQRSKPLRPLVMNVAQRFLRAFLLQSKAP